jgi:hypothetical protein
MAVLHDYRVNGLLGHDIVRMMTALETAAHMLRVTSADPGDGDTEWARLEAAHLDRIRGALGEAQQIRTGVMEGPTMIVNRGT